MLTPRYRRWILKGEKQSKPCAFIRFQLKDSRTVESHRAIIDIVMRVPHQRVGKGALARPVRSHERVDLPLLNPEIKPLDNRFSFHAHV